MNTQSMAFNGAKGLVVTGLAAILVACGGGGGGSDDDPVVETNAIVTQGAIQRFGSVYVNDTRYVRSATGTVKLDDDDPGVGEDELRIGMKVTLRGKRDAFGNGTYDSIEVDNELKGPIANGSISIPDAVNSPKVGSFVVMGTTVISGDSTYFDESGTGSTINSLADLEDGVGLEDVVEVSGNFNQSGQLEALRIEKKADDLATYLGDGKKLEIKGNVASVLAGSSQFTYANGLVVDYTDASIDDDMPTDVNDWPGLYVESECDPLIATGGCFSGAMLVATEIDNEAPEIGDGYEKELEGIITEFNGLDDFKVGYVPVDAADANILCPNVTLGNGVKVKVRGSAIDIGGVSTVDATSVECREAKTVRLEGTVQSEVNGTITLLDVVVMTNSKTEKDDIASIELLDTGDDIQVRGFVDGSGNVIAVRVEFEASGIDPDDFIVQAPKDQVSDIDQGGDRFKLLGVTIDTSGLDGDNNLIDNDFEGVNDVKITRATFYQALLNGTAAGVKAKGTYNPTTKILFADEVELRRDDD